MRSTPRYPLWGDPGVIEQIHGARVEDPFRGLEDTESNQTKKWLARQSALCESYFSRLSHRRAIERRLIELMDYEKIGPPWRRGACLFYYRNAGLQKQSVLHMQRDKRDPEVLLDPNDWSDTGQFAVSGIRLSKDLQWLSYGRSKSGSDWSEWRIRNLDSKQDLPEVLIGIRYALVSWTSDNKGFYYSAVPTVDGFLPDDADRRQEKIFYHVLGTPQSADRLVFELPPGSECTLCGKMSEDGAYLLAIAFRGADDHNQIFAHDLSRPESGFFPIAENFDAYYVMFASQGARLWFRTNWQAERGQIIEIDVMDPGCPRWRVLVPEAEGILERASVVGNKLYVTFFSNGCSRVGVYDFDGRYLCDANVPSLGSVTGFDGHRSQNKVYFSFTGFSQPPTIFEYDTLSNTSSVYWENKLSFDPQNYVTRRILVPAKDGIGIPMFMSHHRDCQIDSGTPTYLYGYGGFGFCHKPFFSTVHLAWMESGGVFCLANVRGGGELGAAWHRAGKGRQKQNTFDDFIACAEWLIESKYTCPRRLAIGGRSNGGLLVGACITQRPDLFRAAVAAVGLYDMVRFHKFTIGWAWRSEYGDPDDQNDLKYLLTYSPLHRVVQGTAFPAVLVATSDHDNRVPPLHSYKFAAALQRAQGSSRPIILRVEGNTGHGHGKPTDKYIEEICDILCFLLEELKMTRARKAV